MMNSLRIAVADDESDLQDYFRKILADLGHQVVAVAQSGRQLVEQCRNGEPDLVITDIYMPDQDGIEAVIEICRHRPVPVILVTGHIAPDHISDALAELVLAYLTKPFKRAELEDAISLAVQRFDEFQELLRISGDRRQVIQDRKLVDHAKGILMMRERLSEHKAFLRLRELAEDKGVNLIDCAQQIIGALKASRRP